MIATIKVSRWTQILLIGLFLCGCERGDDRIILRSEGGFPTYPENLRFLNSEYDDYNSALAPGEYEQYDLFFSSNRASKGNEYDIILCPVSISYKFDSEELSIHEMYGSTSRHHFIEITQSLVNTTNNEFGPYLLEYNPIYYYLECGYIFFYSQEQTGGLDLKFVVNEYDPDGENYYTQMGPYEISLINTKNYNEGYCLFENDRIYYCSDEEDSFDIYELPFTIDSIFVENLTQSHTDSIKPIENINSEAEDKCPYVVDSFMVFTSNRPGGYGGFDLYYSEYIDGKWVEPKNFGNSINSEFDEYRPIIRFYREIPNDLMIFSSNRPGGSGGFDLYYTGIEVRR